MIAPVTSAAASAICCWVRGQGWLPSRTGSPKVIAIRVPRGGSEPSAPPGSRVPRKDTGTTGAPVTSARYAAPARGEAMSPAPAVPSGKTPTTRPVLERLARRSGPRAGRRVTRSSGICPAASRNGPSGPCEHLALGQRVHRPRRADRQQRPVEPADVVGGHHDRPVGGHVLGAVDLDVPAAPGPAAGRRRPRVSSVVRRAAGRRSRAALHRDAESPGHADSARRAGPLSDQRRRRGRRPRSRVYGVVSRWTRPSGTTAGAAARPESIASRRSRSASVAATEPAPFSAVRRARGRPGRRSGRASRRRPGPPPSRCRGPRRRSRRSPMIERWSSSSRARTAGTEATALTWPVTAWVRIASATSMPSTVIVGSRGSVPDATTGRSACAATRRGVVDVDVVVEHPGGHGAELGAGVEVAQAQPRRDAARRARLARPGRPVHRDDDRAAHDRCLHRRSRCGSDEHTARANPTGG